MVAEFVSGNYFRTFGLNPAAGRLLTDSDYAKSAPMTAVMSYETRKNDYNGDPAVVEKSGNAFAVSKSMGHADLKSMEPYQHQELEPLRVAINQRNRRKKFGQVLENAS
jgi:hypothetical protein